MKVTIEWIKLPSHPYDYETVRKKIEREIMDAFRVPERYLGNKCETALMAKKQAHNN